MTKEEALAELQKMTIEEKIAMLSGTGEAYVHGFIDATLRASQKERGAEAEGTGIITE